VAYQLEPHQRIFLQLHYINLKPTAANIGGKVTLKLADAGAGTLKPVHSVFAGATNFTLQPHQPGSAEYFLQPRAGMDGTPHVFSLTSHTHSLGVHATIERVSGIDAAPTTPIHVSDDWAEPPLTQFSPVLDFNGNDGLRLICQYMNDTDRAVHFGTAFNDEMCFMWMYFYLD
jgi:hypothetical protein